MTKGRKNEIYLKLKELKNILKEKYGIKKIAIFGSIARGDYDNNSDIDIVIIEADNSLGYFKLLEAKYFLEKELNRNIDIGFYKSMKTFIKNRIKKDLIYV
ncbi:nucleotidyltransferase family protein [Desulfothermus naphthae]